MADKKRIARTLAYLFAAGPLDAETAKERCRRAIHRCPAWIIRLAGRIATQFATERVGQ